jgi:hypothetical protein
MPCFRLHLLLHLLLCAPAAALAAEALPAIDDGDFEGDFLPLKAASANSSSHITGAVAAEWRDNSAWADVDVAYSRSADAHGGNGAQTVAVTRFVGGAVQFVHPYHFQKGIGLSFSVWLRGTPGQTVHLFLSEAVQPYATYAGTTANLGPEWRQFHVRGVPTKDGPGYLMVMAGQVMRFDIDDAHVEALSASEAGAPARRGNLVAGGSFETTRPAFGWAAFATHGDPDQVWVDVHGSIDIGGHCGEHCLRIDLPAGSQTAVVCSPAFVPNPGRPHSGSVWLKASGAHTEVHLAFDNTSLASSAVIGPDWQRCAITGTMPTVDWARLRITCPAHDNSPMTLWVDGGMVEEALQPSADYLPGAPVEVSLALDLPGHVVRDDAPATVQLSCAPTPPPGAVLDMSVEDLLGDSVHLPPLALPATMLPLPALPGRGRGMFKLRAVVRDPAGNALSAEAGLIWARLAKPRDIPPGQSYFGLHIPLTPAAIAMAQATGMRWIRFHDVCMIGKWAIAEPEPGQWAFFDREVAAAHAAGLGIIGMLDGAPARVSRHPRQGYWNLWNLPDLPGAMEAWRTYVRTVTGHYRGVIDCWEVWNEPYGQWWSGAGGSPAGYAALLQAAYAEAKPANPAVTILGIDTTRNLAWTDNVLAAAGTACFDGMSFHDYTDVLAGGSANFAQREADAFNAAQAQVGTPKPLWNTEGGLPDCGSWYFPDSGGLAARAQVAYAIRYDVTMLAAGVKAFVMYSVHSDNAMGDTTCCDDEFDHAIKPVLAARANLAALIDGVGRPRRSEPEAGVDAYAFPAADGRMVTVYWSTDGALHRLPMPPGAMAQDALGGVLPATGTIGVTQEPIYVIVEGRQDRK